MYCCFMTFCRQCEYTDEAVTVRKRNDPLWFTFHLWLYLSFCGIEFRWKAVYWSSFTHRLVCFECLIWTQFTQGPCTLSTHLR